MQAPVSRHKSLKYLLKEFSASAIGRRLIGTERAMLEAVLSAPASLAHWIVQRHPELVDKAHLRIVVLGAEFLDAFDDGCWYSLVPWLLGNENMRVDVALVGATLNGGNRFEGVHLPHRLTKKGTPQLLGPRIEALLAPAVIAPVTVRDYLRKNGQDADVFAMFMPGFEEYHVKDEGPQWLDEGQLSTLVTQTTAPIAAFSYARVEQATDVWVLRKFGFATKGLCTPNPYAGDEHPGGRWAGVAWEISHEYVPAPGPQDEAEEMFFRFAKLQSMWHDQRGEIVSDQIGAVVPTTLPGEGTPTMLVGLAGAGSWVDPVTGKTYETPHGKAIPLEYQISADVLAAYPGGELDKEFERIAWAMDVVLALSQGIEDDEGDDDEVPDGMTMSSLLSTAAKLTRLKAQLEGREDDGRVFPADVLAGMDEFIYRATGERISADALQDQIRLSGGMTGPTSYDWYNLLGNLEWRMTDEVEEPARFSPAFLAHNSAGTLTFPVICENYTYIPGDVKDRLANEAKTTLAKLYPDGVFLTFKAMPCMKHEEKTFSFGGLVYQHQQWKPVALCATMVGVEAVMQQLEERFSFNDPDPRYEDEHGQFARALNFMTHGQNPNDLGLKTMRLGNGGQWFTLIPDKLGMAPFPGIPPQD